MPTKAQAIDHLIDVLAGSDIKTTGTTAQRVMRLADMIEDGEISIGGEKSGTVEIYKTIPAVALTATVDAEKKTATYIVPGADHMLDAVNRIAEDQEDIVFFVSNSSDPTLSGSYVDGDGVAQAGLLSFYDDVYHVYCPEVPAKGYLWDTTDSTFDADYGFQFDPTDIAEDGSLTITKPVIETVG